MNHPELKELYEHGLDIPEALLSKLMNLAPKTLSADLEAILEEAQENLSNYLSLPANQLLAPLHAFFMLGAMEASYSWDNLISFLKQSESSLIFWFGDYLNEVLWVPFYQMAKDEPDLLEEAIKDQELTDYARTPLNMALEACAMRETDKRIEMIGVLQNLLVHYLELACERYSLSYIHNLTFLVMIAANIKATELMPIIEKAYSANRIDSMMLGSLNDLKQEMSQGEYQEPLMPIYPIETLYQGLRKRYRV